jgi:hypothetical protein
VRFVQIMKHTRHGTLAIAGVDFEGSTYNEKVLIDCLVGSSICRVECKDDRLNMATLFDGAMNHQSEILLSELALGTLNVDLFVRFIPMLTGLCSLTFEDAPRPRRRMVYGLFNAVPITSLPNWYRQTNDCN